MARRFEFLIYWVLIGGAVAYGLGKGGDTPENRQMPRPPVAQPGQTMLPPAARERMSARTLAPMPRNLAGEFSSGTAFAVNSEGEWLTARHVTRDCSSMMLMSEDNRTRIPVLRVVENLGTDLALMETNDTEPQVTFTHRAPVEEEDGFHIGFPQGKPTSVRSSFLGAANVDLGSSAGSPFNHIRTVGHVWAERQRRPDLPGTLGGMSGGPTFDGMGTVIGVTVAEQPRRGRVVTIPPDVIEDMLKRLAITGWRDASDTGDRQPGVTDRNFDRFGEEMRRSVTVARVYCFRSDAGSRRGFLR